MTIFLKQVVAVAPLSIPALLLSLGIFLCWVQLCWMQHWILGTCIFFCTVIGLIYLIRVTPCSKTKAYLFMSIFFIPLGFFVAERQVRVFDQHERLLMEKGGTIHAEITDIEKTPHARFPYCVTLRVTEIQQNGLETVSCNVTLKCCTFRYGRFTVGDYVALTSYSFMPSKGEFRHFLIKEGIGTYLFVPALELTRLSRPTFSISRFLYRKRAALFAILKNQCLQNTTVLFELLFLGRKEKEHEAVKNMQALFRQWGVAHMTARSGMHMTIFIMICYFLLQCIPLTYLLKQLCLALIMLVYACFSYPSISFTRALLTTLLLLYCHCVLRRTNMLHVTFLVYIIQLLFNPIALFFLDFQLSFLLTIGIGFFSKRIFLKY